MNQKPTGHKHQIGIYISTEIDCYLLSKLTSTQMYYAISDKARENDLATSLTTKHEPKTQIKQKM